MPPARPSRFATTCYACKGPIAKGELYTWGKRDPETGHGKGFHPGCYKGESETYRGPEIETKQTEPKAESVAEHTESVADLGSAGAMLDELIRRGASAAAVAAIEGRLAAIEERLAKSSGAVLSVEVRQSNGETVRIDGAHKQTPRLIRYLAARKHVYVWGAPGGGKSTAVEQAARALGLEFSYISLSPQSPRSDLQGLIDAMGTYRAALFRQRFEKGGVILLDEGDNASAAVAVIMNTALANKWGSFPDGMVEMSPDFVCVVAGNTPGRGADPLFPERRLQDSAFLDRFRFMEWKYDEQLEEAVALGKNPKSGGWVQWVRSCRAFVGRERIRGCFFTPRASIFGAEDLRDGESVAETADALCFRGISDDIRSRVLSANPLPIYAE